MILPLMFVPNDQILKLLMENFQSKSGIGVPPKMSGEEENLAEEMMRRRNMMRIRGKSMKSSTSLKSKRKHLSSGRGLIPDDDTVNLLEGQ